MGGQAGLTDIPGQRRWQALTGRLTGNGVWNCDKKEKTRGVLKGEKIADVISQIYVDFNTQSNSDRSFFHCELMNPVETWSSQARLCCWFLVSCMWWSAPLWLSLSGGSLNLSHNFTRFQWPPLPVKYQWYAGAYHGRQIRVARGSYQEGGEGDGWWQTAWFSPLPQCDHRESIRTLKGYL